MSETYSMHGDINIHTKFLIEKSEGKRLARKPKRRWGKYYYEGVDWIQLAHLRLSLRAVFTLQNYVLNCVFSSRRFHACYMKTPSYRPDYNRPIVS